jgi:hypothetical protein
LVPAFDGGDDLVGVGGPGEGFGLLVVLSQDVDRSVQLAQFHMDCLPYNRGSMKIIEARESA